MKRVLFSLMFVLLCAEVFAFRTPDTQPQNPFVVHVVKQGESISSILKRYQLPIDELIKTNPFIKAKGDVSLGDILHIPRKSMGDADDATIDRQIKVFVQQRDSMRNLQAAPAAAKTLVGADNFDYHNVLPKETLYSISRQYNLPIKDIVDANPEIAAGGLKEYTVIRIPRLYTKTQETKTRTVAAKEIVPFEVFDNQREKSECNVTLILPITGAKNPMEDGFIDLYRGFLLAADSMKRAGLSVNIDLFGVGRGIDRMGEVLQSSTLSRSNLIIGPVFDEQFSMVAPVAAQNGTPIVSPLLAITANQPNVFQVAPTDKTYYDKIRKFIAGKNVILYRSANDDAAFISAIERLTGGFSGSVTFNKLSKPESMYHLLSKDKENVFVVAAKDGLNIEMLLSKLVALRSAAYNYRISTLGSSEMGTTPKEKRGDFFKVDLRYITSSFQDRTNPQSMDFETKYARMFDALPSPFAYRGYEIGLMFLYEIYSQGFDIQRSMNDEVYQIIQATYNFVPQNPSSKLVNQEWLFVNYTPAYNILIE